MAKKTKAKKAPAKKSKLGMWFLFSIIILVSLALRLYQPDWYNDRQFHPDERWIVGNAVPMIKYWGDKPIGLQYGSLPLYILSTYRGIVENLRVSFFPRMDMNKAYIGGARAIAGLFDTGTVAFIFFTCLLLFGPGTALLASALLAFTPLNIHSAHFFTVDPVMTFFVAGGLFFAARIYKNGEVLDYIISGIFYGAAIASKTAAAPFALTVLAAHFMQFFSIKGNSRGNKDRRMELWLNLAWAALAAFITFFACMPHALLDFQKFSSDQNEQRRILITGEADVPYNRQYINTTPYLFQIKNLVLYTMGIPFGIAAFAAFFFYIFQFFKNFIKGMKVPGKEIALVLAWLVPYFAIVGMSFGKFNRYMLPMTPFLAILAAKLCVDLFNRVKDKKIGSAIMALVLGGAMFYGVAYMNVYSSPHSWIEASRWMFANISPITTGPDLKQHRTRILNEMWGDDLPVWVDGKGAGDFDNLKWNLQEPDSPNKIEELSNVLSVTDYVIMADKRAYGTYQRLPERYPINYFYYSTMIKDAAKLGYKMVFDKVHYPSLFGIDIKDDKADESFQLYDHPRVYIFKNEKYFPRDQIRAMLIEGRDKTALEHMNTGKPGMQAAGGKVRKDLNNPNIGLARDKITAVIPQLSIFMWYVLVQLLAFMVLPLCFRIFGNLKDKGYGLSKALGIFLFAWINWIVVSLNAWKFYQINLWVLLAVLFCVSLYFSLKNRKEMAAFASENRSYLINAESIFLAAYLAFIVIKLFAPDVHDIAGQGYNGGGEPMGMAYLSAIYNDVKFPPHDPWMSGYTLNYYYWGQLILATISKALGYAPKVTYNLSLSLLFALSFITVFSVSYSMTGKYRYGIFGGFLLACAGNFHTLTFALDRLVQASNIGGFLNSLFSFQFIWDPTRIYPTPVITEMPFFSYLYGDLHAHNIVIPFTVVAIGLVYNILKQQNGSLSILKSFGETKTTAFLSIAVLAVLLGSMLGINTWNFPPLFIFVAVSFLMLAAALLRDNAKTYVKLKPAARADELMRRAGEFAGAAAAFLAVTYISFMPFHAYFTSPYSSIGFVAKPERASVFVMFEYFGVFFFIILAYIYMNWAAGFDTLTSKTGAFKLKIKKFNFDKIMGHVSNVFDKLWDKPGLSARFIIAAACALIAAALLFFQPSFAVLFLMTASVVYAMVFVKNREEMLSLVLLFTALGIIYGTELFHIADGRMNTVFKFYMVGWTFLAIAAPYLLYRVAEGNKKLFALKKYDNLFITGGVVVWLALETILAFVDNRTGAVYAKSFFILTVLLGPLVFFILRDKIGKYIFAAGLIFLLVPAGLYPVIGAFTKMAMCSNGYRQAPRIDGTAYMKNMDRRGGTVTDFDKYDYETIGWINSNMPRIEPILEAPGDEMYKGFSRISIFTGMPAFIGWRYQVEQQSGRSDGYPRVAIADQIYNAATADLALSALKQYGIKYVYIGDIEKSRYSNLDKFATIGEPVYSNEGAVLYKVKE